MTKNEIDKIISLILDHGIGCPECGIFYPMTEILQAFAKTFPEYQSHIEKKYKDRLGFNLEYYD